MVTSNSGSSLSAPLSRHDLTLILFGHSAFQYLNAGAELGLFEHLERCPASTAAAVAAAIQVPVQSVRCMLFGLLSLRLIVKRGDAFSNSELIEEWFRRGQWDILSDVIRFEAKITYMGQSDFADSLRSGTNVGLRHIPGAGPDLYHRLSQSPPLNEAFYNYMGSWSRLSLPLMLEAVDFGRMSRIADIGGGDGTNAIAIAKRYPHVQVTLVDLPENCPVAERRIHAAGLTDRIHIWPANMFVDPLPEGHDCFLFVHQLVIWPPDLIVKLLKRVYPLLPDRGQVVIFNSISSDEEDGPLMAALDSVYFVSIPAEGGMIHPWKLYEHCLRDAGFSEIARINHASWTPHGTVLATKHP